MIEAVGTPSKFLASLLPKLAPPASERIHMPAWRQPCLGCCDLRKHPTASIRSPSTCVTSARSLLWLSLHVDIARGDHADVDRRATNAAQRVDHLAPVLLVGSELLERRHLLLESRVSARRAVLDRNAVVSFRKIWGKLTEPRRGQGAPSSYAGAWCRRRRRPGPLRQSTSGSGRGCTPRQRPACP